LKDLVLDFSPFKVNIIFPEAETVSTSLICKKVYNIDAKRPLCSVISRIFLLPDFLENKSNVMKMSE